MKDCYTEDVIKKIKSTLKAFPSVTVLYYNGEYHVSTGNCIKASYEPDYRVVEEIKDSDVYSEVELVENYINSFNDYPSSYKGVRDYSVLRKMEEGRVVDIDNNTITELYGKLDENGNFMIMGSVSRKF